MNRSASASFLTLESFYWSPAPSTLNLEVNSVYLWQAELERNEKEIQYFRSILSKDEQSHSIRLCRRDTQRRFIIARGLLRTILAHCLRCDPGKLCFGYNRYGKPFLIDVPLYFNLSHSRTRVLYALSLHSKVGVDIEYIYSRCNQERIAKRFFTNDEYTLLNSLEEDDKNRLFFYLWTRKEALSKAKGEGLFTFLTKQKRDAIAKIHKTSCQWILRSFSPEENYLAAVVTSALACSSYTYEWY